jgi:hypothetical protein
MLMEYPLMGWNPVLEKNYIINIEVHDSTIILNNKRYSKTIRLQQKQTAANNSLLQHGF